jgi:MYXO-CTERM domain-containing protein
MSQRRFVGSALSALSLLLAAQAPAQEACGDSTCPKGYECAEATSPCPAIDCASDDCRPCEADVVEYCSPLPCTSDDDCAEGMRCVTEQQQECTGGALPCDDPGGDLDGGVPECPEPEPEECTTTTVSACVPVYLLPCTQASDCGPEGFTCEPVEECGCSGSSGGSPGTPAPGTDAGAAPDREAAPPADGGSSEPILPPDDCVCIPTEVSACRVTPTECTTETAESDCPSGWTCGENPEGVCFSGPDGSGCTPADPPMVCFPPYADLEGGYRGGGTNDGGEDAPTGSLDGGTTPPNAGTGGGGTGGPSDPGAVPAQESGSVESGGCSVSGAPGSVGSALAAFVLAALGLAGLRRRRA